MSINLKLFSFVLLLLFTFSSCEKDAVVDENQVTKNSLIGSWISTSYITDGVEEHPLSRAEITFKEDNTHDTFGAASGFGVTFVGNYVISENGTEVLFKDNVASIGIAGNITYTISDLTEDSVVFTSSISVITLRKE